MPKYSSDTMGILRFNVVETAANTLTEQVVATPTSPASRIAMRVHTIMFNLTGPDSTLPAADAVDLDSVSAGISTRQGLTAVPNLGTTGALFRAEWTQLTASAPADAGASVALALVPGNGQWDYKGGVLIATQQLSIYVDGVAGNQNTKRFQGMILYTLEEVSADELVAALSVTTDV